MPSEMLTLELTFSSIQSARWMLSYIYDLEARCIMKDILTKYLQGLQLIPGAHWNVTPWSCSPPTSDQLGTGTDRGGASTSLRNRSRRLRFCLRAITARNDLLSPRA